MILTPLQLILIIALILIVCGTVTWLVTMHQRDTFNDRINHLADKVDALQYRMHRAENPKPAPSDGLLDPWEHFLIIDGLEERRDWIGGTDIR
jgi:hypothetical protein